MMGSPQHDGGGGGSGGKRPMEVDGGGGVEAKRRKGEVVKGEEEMKRVAELVLVLSAMGRMRGGRDPTVAEAAMMAEARKKVVAMCEELSPKEIVSKEACSGVKEDLGLNQRLGFRPKLSISDRLAFAKRKMEESKAFATQPTSLQSQRLQTGSGAAGEIRGTPPTVRVSSADKVGHVPFSTGTFQHPVQAPPAVQAAPAVHVSTTASISLPLHPPITEVRPPLASTSVPSNAVKDPTSAATPRINRAHIRPDGRPNGPSNALQVPMSSAADRLNFRSTPVPMHPQPPSRVIGAKLKTADQLPVRTGNAGGPQITAHPAAVQTPKPVVSQTAPGTLPTMHHPVQGFQYVHPPAVNHHIEISKVVQRLLHPKLPQRPAWTPPSRDYMNKAHPCQYCKLIINEVENVVICDACEKAFHLECLQSHNVKNIPRGEWHCPRCLTISHGKPFPPKYGRVTRNMNTPKGPSTTSVAQFPSEKKMESVTGKGTQPNVTTNGIASVKAQSKAVNVAEPSSGSNFPHGIDTGRNMMSLGMKKEVGPNMGSYLKSTVGAGTDASLSPSTGSSSDKPPQQAMKFDVPEDGFISETESSTPVITQANSASENLPTSSNKNEVDQKVSNCVESSQVQHDDSNGVAESNQTYNEDRCEKDTAKQNLVVTDRAQDQPIQAVETSESDLHNVDWVGDIDKATDGKKFFSSCRINGVVYHLQDYALSRSSTGKLTPLRLQGMWEDIQSSSKWLLVHRCYFTDDLPDEVGRPGAPQTNEVYESTHDSCMMAGLIQGPCQVLPFRKFGEETGSTRPISQLKERTGPVFIRNWFYDGTKRAFCPNDS